VATLELTLPSASYKGARRRQFFDDVLTRMRAVPGVENVAVVNELPLRGKSSISITVEAEGRPRDPNEEMWFAQLLHTTPSYFETLGIPLLRGRTFTVPFDSARPREVIVNETLARRLWPGEDPLGRRMSSPMRGPAPVVVGVVGDVRAVSLESERTPQMYYDLGAAPPSNAALLARGTLEPRALAARLQDAVHAVDPSQAVYNVRPMSEVISGAIAPRRANTFLITLFGVVAVGLAAIGVYGVIAYGVARRTREIGIRMALGARPGDVVGLVVREGLALAAVGVAIGLAGAWALRQFLAGLLYGITPNDPLAFGGAALVLLGIAAAATLIPARHALRVDPARAIRTE
jgi:putative ABC transport system permease protein